MEFKDVVTLFFERSGAMQTFWNFYIAITLGLLTFFGAVKHSPRLKSVAWLVLVAFGVFASVNLNALLDVTDQRQALADLVVSANVDARWGPPKSWEPLKSTIRKNVPPKELVWAVHLSGDVATAVAVLFLASRPPKSDES